MHDANKPFVICVNETYVTRFPHYYFGRRQQDVTAAVQGRYGYILPPQVNRESEEQWMKTEG